MKKIKKGGKENEAASFYTADEFFLRKGYQIPDLVTEGRRIMDSGIKTARNYSRKMKRRGRLRNMNIAGQRMTSGRNMSPERRLILRHLLTRSIWAERAAWTMR